MCLVCQSYDRCDHDPYVDTDGSGTGGSGAATSKPFYSYDQIASYLTQGFWSDFGTVPRHFDVQTGATITVNLTGLTTYGADTARTALEAWTAVSGLQFQETTSGSADIVFDDNNSGAYAWSSVSGGHIIQSNINIHTSWSGYGDYYLQTYMHEIGHALGLGHTGDYNGSANYGTDAGYANDSWQTSIMSYFSQSENSWTNASYLFLATLQLGDIAAIHQLYGTPVNVETGNTVYGDGQTTGRHGMDLSGSYGVAIVDSGGTDLIDLGSRSHDQYLSLEAETFSNLNGRIGNFAIGRNTVIENATTGSGDDQIIGNAAANRLIGGAGNDVINGGSGDDTLFGGAGADTLTGGLGADSFVFTDPADAGDTITDFSLAEGDWIDITALLATIGYTGGNPVAAGLVFLTAGSGGSWLTLKNGLSDISVAFMNGISASADRNAILGLGTTPDTSDTTYTITDQFGETWTSVTGLITDAGGTDLIDASSVSTRALIYLEPGKTGRVDGATLEIAAGTVIENLNLGRAADVAVGNGVGNIIQGFGGADVLYGGAGDDRLIGGTGDDKLHGGTGNDVILGDDGSDEIFGGDGDDYAVGRAGADVMRGEGGNDVLGGGDGRDLIFGGSGDDKLFGNTGNDVLVGELGNDVIWGEDGSDTVYGDGGNDQIRGGNGRDWLFGGRDADVIDGDAGDDVLAGQGGNDTLNGGDGSDILYGDGGNDTLNGGSDRDWLFGGGDADVMNGDGGDDVLAGQGGNDTLNGGDGSDILYGDGGSDTLNGGNGRDRIFAGADDDVARGDVPGTT